MSHSHQKWKIGVFCALVFFSGFMVQTPLLAQLLSPTEFLGREVGAAFTHHHQLISYAKHVAEHSDQAVYQSYGTSYGGREMGIMVFASAENMKNLEEIRLNNLRLTGLEEGEVNAADAPAIVWLSYNVHGNEASCSEASMLAMYAFANAKNAETSAWLKNTVVIIDPVLNPDGRERYVFNYNQTKGAFANADPVAREHSSNWPSGRTNHYYFDLNRDWAWQTQVESQQRVTMYQQWMPHVHADYHEMGYNSPYYFAPAAEPFHMAITPWQKEFQTTIGKNHVRHFEKEGWLYYSGQVFDLFYPSYGDTWPTFNGAIGMTYEQGGINAGLKVVTMAEDTLTLDARVAHHLTTSLSTVEATSLNKTAVVSQFKTYFEKAKKAQDFEYKAYGIRKGNKADNVNRLLAYLDDQGIEYGFAASNAKSEGFDFKTGKSSRVDISTEDIIIPANQPKGVLVRVLFEPNAVLSDSITYDITAWQAHYVYGLDGYAVKNAISIKSGGEKVRATVKSPIQASDKVYAYISRWESLADAAFLSDLIQAGFKIRYSDSPFTLQGEHFAEGTLIVTRADHSKIATFEASYEQIAKKHNRFYLAAETGFTEEGADLGSNNVHFMSSKKVLVLADSDISQYNLGEIWHFFDRELGYPITIADAARIGRINLSNYDVMIMPEGFYGDLLDSRMDRLRNWISDGGTLIAMGRANSYLEGKEGFALKRKSSDDGKNTVNKSPEMDFDTYAEREREAISKVINGAVYEVNTDNTHPLAYGMEKMYYSLKLSSNHFETNDRLWNVGVIKGSEPRTGFSGSEARSGIEGSLSFGVQRMGSGKVVYFIDNVLYRAFWINGKLLVANAVFFD